MVDRKDERVPTVMDRMWNIDLSKLDGDFMSGKAWDLSSYEYYHPDAAPQTAVEERMRTMMAKIRGNYPEPRLPATEIRIESLNLEPKQRFLYLFDYGDEWQFEVEYVGEGASEEVHYPRVIGLRGESPQQYSEFSEE